MLAWGIVVMCLGGIDVVVFTVAYCSMEILLVLVVCVMLIFAWGFNA